MLAGKARGRMAAGILLLPAVGDGAAAAPSSLPATAPATAAATATAITWMERRFVGPSTMRFFISLHHIGGAGGELGSCKEVVAQVWDYDATARTATVIADSLGRAITATAAAGILGGGNSASVSIADLVGVWMDSHRHAPGGEGVIPPGNNDCSGPKGRGGATTAMTMMAVTTTSMLTMLLLWINAGDASVAGVHVLPRNVVLVMSALPLRPWS